MYQMSWNWENIDVYKRQRVDGRLTGGHRHVGGIGDQSGPIHQKVAGPGVHQLGELLQHLGHLVSALAAADINDDIRVGPFGNLMLGHGLSGSESAGDGGSTALGDGEHGIQDTLSCCLLYTSRCV